MRIVAAVSLSLLASPVCQRATEDQATVSGQSLVGFSPDNSQIFIVGWEHGVEIFEAKSGRFLFSLLGHRDTVRSVEYYDSRRILTVSDDRTAKLWDAQDGSLLFTLGGHEWSPYHEPHARFCPDGTRVLTSGFDESARLWDANTGRLLDSFTSTIGHVSAAVFSPDGARVALAARTTVQVFDLATKRLLFSVRTDGSSVLEHRYSPDGAQLVVQTRGSKWISGKISIWDASDGRHLFTFWEHHAEYSPDAKQLLRGPFDGVTEVIEPASGRPLFSLDGAPNVAFGRSYSPRGTEIVTHTDRLAKIWSAKSGRVLFTLDLERESWPFGAKWSPDGTQMAAAYYDGIGKLWTAKTGELLFTFGHRRDVGLADLIYSPDGARILLVFQDRLSFVWSATTGRQLFVVGPGRR